MIQQLGLPIQEYLDKNIKDVIREFPPVADVLNRYGIGCVTCGLGTCLFKDIVEIHALGPGEEAALLAEISRVIYPDREVAIPRIERKSCPPAREAAYSPPMKKLVDEHQLIKRLLAIIPGIIEELDLSTETGRQVISQSVDFIRSYADKFHHAKEEDILFKCFDENLDIIKTICTDHENGRALVREVLAALERQDRETVISNLEGYTALLTEHIKKEDEILYRWMDRNLTMTQIGELFSRFSEKDKEFAGTPEKYQEFIAQLEKKIIPRRK
ncbi:MAG: hemerythrin domain-containing protein [Dehalococcoidales bacterium]|nr:hemerythrin domain-containing protein [Dehalococcoidales bacterium]